MKKKLCFTRKQRKLYRIFLIAESLEKRLKWVPTCENGLERIVEFFREIVPLDEYYYSFLDLYFWSPKKKKLLSKLQEFIFYVNYSDHKWNRTKEGEVPSDKTIFIFVSGFIEFSYEEVNLNVYTQSVKRCIDQNIKENFPGQREKERNALNEIACTFMKDTYKMLEEAVKNFR